MRNVLLLKSLFDHISSSRRTGCISHNEDCFIVYEVFMYYSHASNLFSILVDHISSNRRTGCISHGEMYTMRMVLSLMRFSCIIYIRTLVKSLLRKFNFLISQPKHMLWVLKRTF